MRVRESVATKGVQAYSMEGERHSGCCSGRPASFPLQRCAAVTDASRRIPVVPAIATAALRSIWQVNSRSYEVPAACSASTAILWANMHYTPYASKVATQAIAFLEWLGYASLCDHASCMKTFAALLQLCLFSYPHAVTPAACMSRAAEPLQDIASSLLLR